jgi:hypothetical protein
VLAASGPDRDGLGGKNRGCKLNTRSAEQVELDQLQLQLDAIEAAAMKAPAMGALLGNSLAKFMATEEKRISVSHRIYEIEL